MSAQNFAENTCNKKTEEKAETETSSKPNQPCDYARNFQHIDLISQSNNRFSTTKSAFVEERFLTQLFSINFCFIKLKSRSMPHHRCPSGGSSKLRNQVLIPHKLILILSRKDFLFVHSIFPLSLAKPQAQIHRENLGCVKV